ILLSADAKEKHMRRSIRAVVIGLVAILQAPLARAVEPDAGEKQSADVKALEDRFRTVRREMIRASCDADMRADLDKFEAAHAKAAQRLLSPDQMDVCQGLMQVKNLGDRRAGPYVAFYMREYGPVGDYAVKAGVECRHPLVIASAIERLRGPTDIRA